MAKQLATQSSSPLAMLSKQPGTVLENFDGFSPYLQFTHSMNKNAREVTAVIGVCPSGTPVYINGKDFIKCSPVTYIATTRYEQGYGLFDNVGRVINYFTADGSKPPEDWREICSALLIVEVNGNLKPARCEFRGPKTAGFKAAMAQVAACAEPQWKDFTKENGQVAKLAAKAGIPEWAFLTHVGHCTTEKPKDPKKNDYDLFHSTSKTSSTAMLEALSKAMKDDEFNATVQHCMDDMDKRLASFLPKTPAA